MTYQILWLAKAGNRAEIIGQYAAIPADLVRQICAQYKVEVQ